MAFVQFQKEITRGSGRIASPVARINKTGHLRFNKAACEEFKLAEVKAVTLHWDSAREFIGLMPCAVGTPFSVPLRLITKDQTVWLSSIQFLRHFKIDTALIGVLLTPSLENGMIVLAPPPPAPKKKLVCISEPGQPVRYEEAKP